MTYRFWLIIRFIVVTVVSMHGFSATAADYGETVKYLRAGSFHKAHSQFSTLAEKGDTNAQFQLGLMAHLGHGIPQNFLVARKWYERAAKNGEVRSQNNLGIIYRDGLGILPDAVRAYKWFSLAAAQRNEQAIVNLRMLLHDLDKADILTGQRLAQQHYDKLEIQTRTTCTAYSTSWLTHSLNWLKVTSERQKIKLTEFEFNSKTHKYDFFREGQLSLLRV